MKICVAVNVYSKRDLTASPMNVSADTNRILNSIVKFNCSAAAWEELELEAISSQKQYAVKTPVI